MSKYPGIYCYLNPQQDLCRTAISIRADWDMDGDIIADSGRRFHDDIAKSKLDTRDFILANLQHRDFQYIL